MTTGDLFVVIEGTIIPSVHICKDTLYKDIPFILLSIVQISVQVFSPAVVNKNNTPIKNVKTFLIITNIFLNFLSLFF